MAKTTKTKADGTKYTIETFEIRDALNYVKAKKAAKKNSSEDMIKKIEEENTKKGKAAKKKKAPAKKIEDTLTESSNE